VQEKSQHMAMGALPAALTVVLQDELVELVQAGGVCVMVIWPAVVLDST